MKFEVVKLMNEITTIGLGSEEQRRAFHSICVGLNLLIEAFCGLEAQRCTHVIRSPRTHNLK